MNTRHKTSFAIAIYFSLCSVTIALAQSTIPPEYRGDPATVARGILDGNLIETNYRNIGVIARFGDTPFGVWPRGIGLSHIKGFNLLHMGVVPVERLKWPIRFPNALSDTVAAIVALNIQSGGRRSSIDGESWNMQPLPGFLNSRRFDYRSSRFERIPATSDDKTSWPDEWPDKLSETTDIGWSGSWNGFRGKGNATGDQETFYVMDDSRNRLLHLGVESREIQSFPGVYYASPSDSLLGGLGLQTEVRSFQFDRPEVDDVLFVYYRTTNISEKDLDNMRSSLYINPYLGTDELDNNFELIPDEALSIGWDSDGIGIGPSGEYNLGYIGTITLELSTMTGNGLDDDQDGITDESKANIPGARIEGQNAIRIYLDEQYDVALFEENVGIIDSLPAFRAGIWWTGDEDLDWVGFSDVNENGTHDEGEPLNNDVGRDGIGPGHEHYTEPDEGEGDGIPTQGEPHFGERDMGESDQLPGNSFAAAARSRFQSTVLSRDDSLYQFISDGALNTQPLQLMDGVDYNYIQTTPSYSIDVQTSSHFIVALVFGEDRDDFLSNLQEAKQMYNADFDTLEYSPVITSTHGVESEEKSGPKTTTLHQNYPNPFNPSTTFSFSLPATDRVSLSVYDLNGRLVERIARDRVFSEGSHTLTADLSQLASGTYLYVLSTSQGFQSRKLTLIK
ncbi:MAG: T9SS type A sorting domain-containing protein [Bacteroidota bacterium]